MIEFARLPARRVVAPRTIGRVFACGKLSPMRVKVAAGAWFRSGAEIDIFQIGLERRGAMAVRAGYAAVRAQQSKRSLRMVEAVHLFPHGRGVAGFAARNCAVRTLGLHALAELPLVRVQVTSGAGTICKLVFHGRRR